MDDLQVNGTAAYEAIASKAMTEAFSAMDWEERYRELRSLISDLYLDEKLPKKVVDGVPPEPWHDTWPIRADPWEGERYKK